MSGLLQIDRARFAALPVALNADGRPRRTGVELEFAGLTEREAVEIAQACLGGRAEPVTSHEWRLEQSRVGRLKVYLDTALRDLGGSRLADLGLDLSRAVVPVEIVTEPLAPGDLPRLDDLRDALRRAGAEGSREGVFFGFGLHLNPEIEGPDVARLLPVLTAYALMEDWLRHADPMDTARRILPFSDPYPRRFVDELAAARGWTLGDLFDAYLHWSPTRNRGLDMLPVLAHLDEARVAGALGGLGAVSARPAWHYRLPDSRVDEADWSIAYEWNRWVAVERLAHAQDRLARLAADWRDHRAAILSTAANWRAHVDDFLLRHHVIAP